LSRNGYYDNILHLCIQQSVCRKCGAT